MPSLNGLYPGGISYEIVGSITDLVSVVSVTIFPVLTKVCLIVDDSIFLETILEENEPLTDILSIDSSPNL